MAVHSVVVYFVYCLCNGKVIQEEGLGTCNKCNAVLKMIRCKRSSMTEFSIAEIGKMKVFLQALESVIELEIGDDETSNLSLKTRVAAAPALKLLARLS